MLIHVLAKCLNTSVGQAWLATQFNELPKEWRIDFDNNLEFCEIDVRWSSGRVVKLLAKTESVLAVPLLWELNRYYDDGDDTSMYLRTKVQQKFGGKLESVPFYRQHDELVLTCMSKQQPKSTAEIQCKIQEGKLVVQLPPSVWLREVLVEFLKERSL
jgi:hypothetical protein